VVAAARLPPDLLDRSAPEAARLLALSYLHAIDQARDRLGDALAGEALHDFRVGIRRLRSAVRAYRNELAGSVSGKERGQLRKLARATNDGRDVEVQLDWLVRRAEGLKTDEVPGFFWLAGRLEDRKQKTHDRAVADVARRYDKWAARLKRSLGVLRIELGSRQGQRPASFREVTGALVRQQVARVREDLGRIAGSSDAKQAHRTRISLKRLRYLLEPVARRNRRAGALVRRFKEAQDLLGEHHDMHVLLEAVAGLRRGASASTFSGVDSGLATVGRLADEAAVSAFDRFSLVWGGGAGERILSRVEELGRALEAEPALVEHRAPETPPEPPPLNLVQQSEPPMLSPVSVR
jgi:CHAD domain-containing protein